MYPFHSDATTGELYLRLPDRLDKIIITPPRLGDAAALVEILSNSDIVKWLAAIPQPYRIQDAEDWLRLSKKQADDTLKQMTEAHGDMMAAASCPFRILREVRQDGTQFLIGSIGVGRSSFSFCEDAERERLAAENAERALGDPDIVWEMGDYLAFTHHDRGIMTAAIGTVIREWVVPHMGAHHIVAAPYIGNTGSVRTFEKNGFVLEKVTRRDIVTVAGEAHSGETVLRWDRVTSVDWR